MDIKAGIIYALAACGTIIFALAIYSLRHRKTVWAMSFFALMLSFTFYSWGYALELAGADLEWIMTAIRIQYVGLAVFPAFWLILAMQYTGSGRRLTLPVYAAIFIIPLLTLVLVNTNGYHHLYYATVGLRRAGPFTLLTRTIGIAYLLQFIYLNLCILAGNMLYFRMLLRTAPAYKKQAATMFAGSLLPWIANFVYQAGMSPYGIDINVFALAVTSPFFAVALFRSRMLDLVPVARDSVFDSMTESVLVVDDGGRIADVNRAACALMDLSPAVVGRLFRDVLSGWPEIVGIIAGGEHGHGEVSVHPPGGEKWFTVNLSPFFDRRGRSVGQILIMHDVTEKKLLEIRVFENEKRLKTDIMKVRNLQATMMPDFSAVAGYDAASIFIPLDELSGDFYDGFFIEGDTYQIILCDVMGHGILSAFIGMEIRSMFRAMSDPAIPPSELIARVNAKLTDDFSDLYIFATVAVCRIDLRTGRIVHSSGGHPPLFLYSSEDRSVSTIEAAGPLIGLMRSKPYADVCIDMKMNDILVLYTDGVYEATKIHTKEMYGIERMESDLAANAGTTSKDLLNSMIASVYEFTEYAKINDDMTMVCLKRLR